MGQDVVRVILASDVAAAGTFTVTYPPNKDPGAYAEISNDHYIYSWKYGLLGTRNGLATFAFGASAITVTNASSYTLEAGTELYVNLDQPGAPLDSALASPERMATAEMVWVQLGAPDAIVVDGVCLAQSATGAHTLLLNGSLAAGGVVTLDKARNLIADSGGADTAVLTITGTDIYGKVMKENITLAGTAAVSGKKAFKTITSVTSSATIANGAFLGTGDVLGLPVHIPEAVCLIKESQDGAVPTAGTLVLAVNTKATATTGDVRGTYDPNVAMDGAKSISLLFALTDPSYRGVPQYAG